MKQRLFLDTNVMLDILAERVPHFEDAEIIASIADKNKIKLFVSAISFSTCAYLLGKIHTAELVKEKLRKFKILAEISNLDNDVIEKGLNSKIKDFEDALQYYSALNSNCDIIISRNVKDFKGADIPIMTPNEFLLSLKIK